jgi:hypothetical protein
VPSRPSAESGPLTGHAVAERLRAAIPDLELDGLALSEQLGTAGRGDLGGMDEQVLAAVVEGQEPEATVGVEPADDCMRH